jgi:hypothetical protein
MCLSPVFPSGKPHPPQEGSGKDPPRPCEQLTNRMARLFEMQRRASEVSI